MGIQSTTVRFFVVLAVLTGCARDEGARQAAQKQVAEALQSAERQARGRADGEVWKNVRRFYESTDFEPAWLNGTQPAGQWDRLLDALSSAGRHGLDPRAYDVDDLQERRARTAKRWARDRIAPEQIGETDVRLSYSFVKYATHLLRGELDPEAVNEQWLARRRKADLVAALTEVKASGNVKAALEPLVPRHPEYVQLAAAFERYRSNREASPAQVHQIALNLERWRWLPETLGEHYLIVNIPSYELRVVENGRESMRMRVVVGKKFNPTPVFSDEITYLTFNPQWNVPESIQTEELVPSLKEDDQYLEKHDMELVREGEVVSLDDVDLDDMKSFKIRQRSGKANALGQVKFVFPNQFDVYLHDTPADALFAREDRAFSHGCVRVEKPIDLATRVLEDQPAWDRAAIEKAIASAEEKSVTLKKPLPVHIVYWTAWAEADGSVRFADDVYGYDRTQSAALERARPRVERQASR